MIPTSNAKVVVIRAKRAPRKCTLNALLTATMISSHRKIDPLDRTCGCMLFTKVSCVTLRRLSSMRASPKTTEITIADAAINDWSRKPRTSVEGRVRNGSIDLPTADLQTVGIALACNQDGGGSVAERRLAYHLRSTHLPPLQRTVGTAAV